MSESSRQKVLQGIKEAPISNSAPAGPKDAPKDVEKWRTFLNKHLKKFAINLLKIANQGAEYRLIIRRTDPLRGYLCR